MPFNSQLYAQARPDLTNNWQRAHDPNVDPNNPNLSFILQFPSFNDYLANDFSNNPQGEQQQNAVAAPGSVTATTANINNIANTPTTPPPQNTGAGAGFSTLTPPPLPNLPPPTNTPPPPGGNYNQSQTGGQTGAFSTGGETLATGGGTTVNNTSSLGTNTTGTNTTTGGTTSNVGTNNTTGTNTTNGTNTSSGNFTGLTNNTNAFNNAPTDLLGFGSLLAGQAGNVNASDAARSSWLQDVMQNGGTGFNSQVDQAIRQSLSGPGMAGTGQSAQARAAGYAAADIARNNLNQRLAASGQLSGPTGLATLSSAAVPYGVGQSGVSTGNQTSGGTSNLTGTNNSTGTTTSTGTSTNNGTNTGFSNLLSNATNTLNSSGLTNTGNWLHSLEGTTGIATGGSSSSAAGNIPSTNTVSTGGGGCVLCTAAVELGLERNLRVLRRVIRYKLVIDKSTYASAARGYFYLFTPLAHWLLGRPKLARFLYPLTKAVVYQELRISGRRLPRSEWACFVHNVGHALCHIVGKFSVPGRVTDSVIEKIARKNNIWFSLS